MGTRCGATITKELERAGIPTAQICTITSIAQAIGVARVVPGVGIPHPLGNPALDAGSEKKLRREKVERAREALSTPLSEARIFLEQFTQETRQRQKRMRVGGFARRKRVFQV